LIRLLTALFPVWALVFAAWGLLRPEVFTGLKPLVVPLLGLVMFGMGMTLRAADFRDVLRRPRLVGLGLVLQYGLMPLFAWALARAFGVPPEVAAGLVLVGACPGGTASNVVCYLARGDLALSITLTACSTLIAVAATPGLTWLYIGQTVPVPVWAMLGSVAKVVLLPVLAGVAINSLLGPRLGGVKRVFPLVSVGAIVVIIAVVVALNSERIAGMALMVAALVAAHNALGLLGGYWSGRLLGFDRRVSRTLAIEVGMQNSGLGATLATQYFGAAAALPAAVFSVWHNLSGSALAAWWSRRPTSGGYSKLPSS
jgi:BASS family bile acid:Na+ symporter